MTTYSNKKRACIPIGQARIKGLRVCKILNPSVAIAIHYSFMVGNVRDLLLLKYTQGRPESFFRAASESDLRTEAKILSPGQRFEVRARQD